MIHVSSIDGDGSFPGDCSVCGLLSVCSRDDVKFDVNMAKQDYRKMNISDKQHVTSVFNTKTSKI